jgi:hypothetical protein
MKQSNLRQRTHKVILIAIVLTGLVGCREPVSSPPGVSEPAETQKEPVEPIDSFEACVAAGMPVMEIYPQQCRTEDGQVFVEDIGNEIEKMDLIQLEMPRPNQVITSPLTIKGQARGTWFFEGDFPVKLLDENGEVIARHYLTAQGEWMTEDFVQFSGELEFTVPDSERGTLVLEKDNPSGLPEHADELTVPVRFQQSP